MQIKYVADLLDPSGYSESARQYVRVLFKSGFKIKTVPLSNWGGLSVALEKSTVDLLRRLEGVHLNSGKTISIEHTIPDVYKEYSCFANIGFTTFETDSIPPQWIEKCNKKSQIWVPSEFNKWSFQKAGVRNVRAISHIIDSDYYNPEICKPFSIPNRRKFVFLSIFDFTFRKGYDILLKAFWEEFSAKDDVCLVLKVYFGGVTKRHQEILKDRIKGYKQEWGSNDTAPILFFGDILSQNYLRRLYRSADCFVLPTRGEGFGLPVTEAMSMKLPVIVTNWSAPTEYLDPKATYPLRIEGLERNKGEMLQITPNYKGQHCAVPDKEHLKHLMRWVYTHQEEAKQKGELARKLIISKYHPKVVGEKIKRVLGEFL